MALPAISLRRIPYPYKAMLAICSDLDETPDRQVYWEIMRFLNTTENTAMGPGAGLEVGNTIYFDMPPGQFAYWSTDDAGRAMVRDLIRSGHIDCLHSFGDLADTRAHAGRALDELSRHNCRLTVWIDHAVAPSNFGPDIMHGYGDVPGSPVYHADLTLAYGVKYVWRGRVTSVTGQDVPARLGGIFTYRHPVASAKTWGKEIAKRNLAKQTHEKYAMHGPNRIMRRSNLRDGAAVWEFIRCNPHWGGVSRADTAAGLAEVLTDSFLDRLAEREGICILYTHLGKIRDRSRPFGEATCGALERLARRYQQGQILVTSTARLLGYLAARDGVQWKIESQGGISRVHLEQIAAPPSGPRVPAPEELAGLTFESDSSAPLEFRIAGREFIGARHSADKGRSVSWLPIMPLEFPSQP